MLRRGLERVGACALAAGVAAAPTAAVAQSDDFETFGDIMQIALPVSALASTFVVDDPEGRAQFGKSFATGFATVHAGKFGFEKMRPNRSNTASFPSGHTFSAFSGAAYLGRRYQNPWLTIPAYTAAVLTGASRVNADKHFVDDVTAGASIALLANFLFVNPIDPELSIAPTTLGGDGVGVRLRLDTLNADGPGPDVAPRPFDPKFRFELSLGPSFLDKNEITSPENGGTTFDLNDFSKTDDPTTTAGVTLDYFLDDRQTLSGFFNFFESRDVGQFRQPTFVKNTTFPANTNVNSEYRFGELTGKYEYDFIQDGPFRFKAGGGLTLNYVQLDLSTNDESSKIEISEAVIFPLLLGEASYEFVDNFSLFGSGEGFILPDDAFVSASAGVKWNINQRWDAKAEYNYRFSKIESGDLKNEVAYHGIFASLSHKF